MMRGVVEESALGEVLSVMVKFATSAALCPLATATTHSTASASTMRLTADIAPEGGSALTPPAAARAARGRRPAAPRHRTTAKSEC